MDHELLCDIFDESCDDQLIEDTRLAAACDDDIKQKLCSKHGLV